MIWRLFLSTLPFRTSRTSLLLKGCVGRPFIHTHTHTHTHETSVQQVGASSGVSPSFDTLRALRVFGEFINQTLADSLRNGTLECASSRKSTPPRGNDPNPL
uniref:Putative secreted protein n=1 Tax=Anopheles darlingi TaxID=43151 RepID=A0A2M4D241_ANODA